MLQASSRQHSRRRYPKCDTASCTIGHDVTESSDHSSSIDSNGIQQHPIRKTAPTIARSSGAADHKQTTADGTPHTLVVPVANAKTATVSAGQRKIVDKYGKRLQAERLYEVPLTPVDCRFGVVREDEGIQDSLRSVVKEERKTQGSNVTVVFCVRRPGCGSCRDHAQQLVEMIEDVNKVERDGLIAQGKQNGLGMLASSSSSSSHSNRSEQRQTMSRQNQKVALVGVTKHGEGVDDKAMLYFYQTYFQRYLIHRDGQWETFQALGGRKISLYRLLRLVPRMEKRYKNNNIENIKFGGDIWTQGGVLVFDRQGELRHVHYEEYGNRLDTASIRTAIEKVQEEQRR
mmetsp:Transcript_2272/g.5913  ORF Transcript_2272/g.5913 Transcript_2272/m.5913 type:complete len:345 (-) Transcript_2272:104-1138(-)